MLRRRVVITGMGIVSPIGNTVSDFWAGLREGRNGIAEITHFDCQDHRVKLAGEIKNLNLHDYIDKRELNRFDRFAALAIIAADEAIAQSRLDCNHINCDNIGVITGSGVGGIDTFSKQYERLMKSPRRVSPFFIPMMISDIAAGHISIKHGFKGPNYSIVSACATSSHAIGDAFRMIQYGDADVIVAGGSEAAVVPIAIAGFANMKALSTNPDPNTASRPFDLNRDGFVLSEGAGFIILEEIDHAQKRSAEIFGEIVGYGATGDAHHVTAPSPDGEGAARAMRLAVKNAGISIDDVNYINAHGTSTHHNDITETKAIKSVFGDRVNDILISSTKSMTGHLLGAAGSVEGIATILAIRNSLIPPTINYSTPDPECDLNYAPNEAQNSDISYAISNNFGFGGHNAVLVFRKWES